MEDAITNLLASLVRGGDIWTGRVGMADRGDGHTYFALYLKDTVPESARGALSRYIKGYLKRSGWRARTVRITRRYVEVALSNT